MTCSVSEQASSGRLQMMVAGLRRVAGLLFSELWQAEAMLRFSFLTEWEREIQSLSLLK
jgi:hypothetical protein